LFLVTGSRSVLAHGGTGNDPALVSIAVTPADASILPDRAQQFTATGTYSDGRTHDLTRKVTWSSSVPDVATISREGLARAITSGQTTIEAAVGAINGSTTLNVTRFVWTGSTNTPRYEDTATLLNNGMVLIAGGGYGVTTELYNPATGTFTPTGSMAYERISDTATLLNNGIVLMASGVGAGATAELYNPATGTFTLTGSMNAARFLATATLLNNGLVLVAGGQNSSGILASAELYNPATGTFTYTGRMNTSRYLYTATLLNNGMVLFAGGINDQNQVVASAELYDPATGIFTPTGSMNIARWAPTATLLNNGMVLVAGGGGAGPSGPVDSAELYDPAAGTFSYTNGSMTIYRVWDTATLLNNGMVLMAGGAFGAGPTAELYDPATGTFTPTDSMNTAREFQTGTLLNNGLVLIAGGAGLASAELYEPATLTPPDLESIAITPARSTLSPGATQQFIATGTFSHGSKQQLASVIWSSSDPRVAQISNDASNHGVGLAIAPGNVIVAAHAGWVWGWAWLTVK
jgi:hypothetical protein